MTSRMISRPRAHVVVALATVCFLAVGCSAEPTDGDATSEPTPTDTTATVEDEITSSYLGFWDAVVASENGPDTDPAPFKGLADDAVTGAQIDRVTSMRESGEQRAGEPTIADTTVNVDGETARVESCVDQTTWASVNGDQTSPPRPPDPKPMAFELSLVDDNWLVTARLPQTEATLTC